MRAISLRKIHSYFLFHYLFKKHILFISNYQMLLKFLFSTKDSQKTLSSNWKVP